MKENIFKINHSEFGIEEFRIDEPKYNLYKSEDGIWEFTISFKTSESIKRVKELEEIIDVNPNFEATALLSPNNLILESERIIIQKESYDYEREENLSNIYYFEHSSIEKLEIKIIEFHSNWIIIEGKGIALINGSNGNEPDSELYIYRTKFQLDKELERGIM